jgi:hypothetical protein
MYLHRVVTPVLLCSEKKQKQSVLSIGEKTKIIGKVEV